MKFFLANGYQGIAASWPGDAETTEATRRNARAVAGYGVTEIADHIAGQLKILKQKPILIGHSFGDLLVQNLLGRDLAFAAVAIDPAPIKGVTELPRSGSTLISGCHCDLQPKFGDEGQCGKRQPRTFVADLRAGR